MKKTLIHDVSFSFKVTLREFGRGFGVGRRVCLFSAEMKRKIRKILNVNS